MSWSRSLHQYERNALLHQLQAKCKKAEVGSAGPERRCLQQAERWLHITEGKAHRTSSEHGVKELVLAP